MRILALLLLAITARAADKPNILWITSEDNAAHWLGCYGNQQAATPRLDRLAEQGNRFLHAYSNAPVCAVARSTILTGVHAPSQGTQHMRSRHAIPAEFKPYVTYLREQGYYCTNASKTDFNIKGDDRAIWDECSGKAHYRKRAEGQPFFAVFNFTVSHESSLFPGKRAKPPYRLKPSEIDLPPHLPDLPEFRDDFAAYHEKLSQLDAQVGKVLDDLEKAGLAGDTIVFYYADHGGPTARGKRYLKDTGVRVPMIVRVPEKWKHLSPFEPGATIDEPVAFVDLAPTLLSLIGMEKPAQMQGRAFLGEHRTPPKDGVFLFADRFDEIYGMRRGWTDGRWKYIRRFTPYLPAAPYSYYQFGQPSWVAWRKAWQEGTLDEAHRRIWETPQPVEELFDLEADPWEIRNLAGDPQHADRLKAMRERLKAKMAEVKDTGIIPEPMFEMLCPDLPVATFARSEDFDYDGVLDLAFVATSGERGEDQRLQEALRSDDLVKRYWGLVGRLVREDAEGVRPLLEDDAPVNRVLAAEVLDAAGETQMAEKALLAELDKDVGDYSTQYLLNALTRLGVSAKVPDAWIEEALKGKRGNDYVKRFAQRLREERK
ncbi:sulfatase [Haloferula sp. A504]|uniref:sulfatase n=1 Tax=Haloferula sp. A504 TaxID=3373601 RepID=UPI0031BC83E3|nr:sulfatase [Verrucomicrobiaceae bacterium E54]